MTTDAPTVRRRRTCIRRIPGPTSIDVPCWYACEIMGISPSTLYQMRLRGDLPASAFRGRGRGTRVLRSAIEAVRA